MEIKIEEISASRIPQPKAASESRDTELILAIVNIEYQATRGPKQNSSIPMYIRWRRKGNSISSGAAKEQRQERIKNGKKIVKRISVYMRP